MTRIRTTLLAMASLLVFAAGALPASADEYSEPGGYLILGGLNAFEHFPEVTGVSNLQNSMGFQIRAGARILEFLAAEVEGDFISGFDFDVTDAGGAGRLVLEGGNITVNVKGYWPLGPLQPYGMIGIGGMWASIATRYDTGYTCTPGYWSWWCSSTRTRLADGGSFVAKFGGGADFWLTDDWALTIDAVYTMPTGELEDFAYTTLGWGVKFKF